MHLSKRLFVGPFFLAIALCLGTLSIYPAPVLAHGGHAGKKVVFVAEKEALRAMLPTGAKIAKRKQTLTDTSAGWIVGGE